MSAIVDNRVVQMKFDNAQFERGIRTSLDSLARLKSSLNFDGISRAIATGFSNIERSMSLSGISAGVDSISDRFSAMGVVGTTVLSNLTTQAMNLASKLGNIVLNPIIEGGKSRAMNIEQAKFQLEGLDVAWEKIEDDINYGVKDTAYGLDAAAKVASQLVASQVQIGEPMKKALRGISGVAAMTSSSYEDIGQVFTAVAGQGRVMAMQLNQLSLRGINAAATLGKYLHVTEADVREMTSKGQIDFATFAAAMDDAYGAHAKDANKTFTGAMSNTRAALSRIGAKFATPAYNNLRDVLNALIPVINNVNKALDPMVSFAEKNMESAAKTVAAILGNVEKMNFDSGAIKNITDAVGFLASQGIKAFRAVKKGFRDVFSPLTAKDAEKITKTVKELAEKFKMTDKNADRLRKTVKNVFTIFKRVGGVVSGVIGMLTPAMNKASDIFDLLFKKAEAMSGKAAAAVNKLIKMLDGVKNKASGFFSGFDKGVVVSNLQKIVKLFTNDLTALKPRMQNLFTNVKTAVEPIIKTFGKAGGAVKKFFTNGLTVEQERHINLFSETFAAIADSVISVGKAMVKAVTPIISAITEMFPKVSMNRVLTFFEDVSDFAKKLVVSGKTAENIKNTVKGLFAVVDIGVQLLTAVLRVIFPTTDGLFSLRDGILSVTGGLGEWLTKLSENLRENDTFYYGIKKLIDLFKTGFDTAKEKLSGFADLYERITGKEPEKLTFDGVIEKFVGAFEKIRGIIDKVKESFDGFIEWFNSDNATEARTKAIDTIVEVLGKLSDIVDTMSPGLSDFFSNLADSIGKINYDRMAKIFNIAAIVVLVNALSRLRGILSDAFSFLGGPLFNVNKILSNAGSVLSATTRDLNANILVKTATAIALLAASLVALSAIPSERLTSAIGAMTLLFVGLIATLKAFDEMLLYSLGNGWAFVQMSASLTLIATAVAILSGVLAQLSKVDPVGLITGLGAVLAILAALVTAASIIKPAFANNLVIMAAGIVIMSVALRVLAGALTVVGKIENVMNALDVLSGALLLFGMQGAILGKFAPLILAGSIVINALAASITVLAGALMVVSNVKSGLEGLLLMTSVLAVFSAAALLFANYIHIIAPFASLMLTMSLVTLVMSSALTVLAGALRLLSGTNVEVLFVLISAMGILSITASLFAETIPVLLPFAGGIAAIGAAMVLFSAGVGALSIAITMLSASTASLPIIIYSIGNLIVALVESIISIGMAILVGLEALVPKLVDVAFKIVMTLVGALVKNLPLIVKGGLALILGILKGIESHIGDILIVTGTILVKFLDGFSIILPQLVNAGVNLIISLINGMADAIRDNAEPLFNALGNLVSSIIEFAITALQQLVRGIPMIGDEISDALEKEKAAIREELAPDSMNDIGSGAAKGAVDGVSSAEDDAESAGFGLGQMVTEGLGSVLPSMGSLGEGFGEEFTGGLGDSLPDMSSIGLDLGTDFSGGLGDSLPDMSSIGLNLGTDFSGGLGSTEGLTSDAVGGLGDSITEGLDIDLSALGLDSGTTYARGMTKSKNEVDRSSDILTDSAENSLKSANGDFKSAGVSNASNYANGLATQRNNASRAAYQVARSGIAALNSKYNDYVRAGYHSGVGYSVGLGNSEGAVYNAAAQIAQTALNAMQNTLDMHSPSRKFERFGQYSDEGYARGVLNNTDVVYAAAKKIGDTATNAMSAAVMHVSDVMLGGMDDAPTIRPVVDLDDVINGVSAINGMFAGTSVNLGTIRGDISYRNAGLLSAIASEMNGGMDGSERTVAAIDDLRSEVAQLGLRISRMQVRMDSGALVGQLADPLDAEFGRRAVMKGRGV